MDAEVSGNKWFKLRYHLAQTLASGKSMLTFGGAWSNHILATAALCAEYGIPCTGIIRGEQPANPSRTLLRAAELGMELCFVSRTNYAANVLPAHIQPDSFHIIPEGGYGETGADGAATIRETFTGQYNLICCAAGTGTMLAGLINSAPKTQRVLGFSVLKDQGSLEERVRGLLHARNDGWAMNHQFHFGGYAKHSTELVDFMNRFYEATGIPTDFVYTGKLFYGVDKLVRRGTFAKNTSILVIHSGGLAGNAGLPKGTLMY